MLETKGSIKRGENDAPKSWIKTESSPLLMNSPSASSTFESYAYCVSLYAWNIRGRDLRRKIGWLPNSSPFQELGSAAPVPLSCLCSCVSPATLSGTELVLA